MADAYFTFTVPDAGTDRLATFARGPLFDAFLRAYQRGEPIVINGQRHYIAEYEVMVWDDDAAHTSTSSTVSVAEKEPS